MAISAKITIIGKQAPIVSETREPAKDYAKSLTDIRDKAKPKKPDVKVEPKPLVKQKIINTVYSDKLDVSKPSKYTEHFLK